MPHSPEPNSDRWPACATGNPASIEAVADRVIEIPSATRQAVLRTAAATGLVPFLTIPHGRTEAAESREEVVLRRLYDTPHEFNLEMQAEAWAWLRQWIGGKGIS
jgi:hypothetical protein